MAKGTKTGGRQKGKSNVSTEETREWASRLKVLYNVDEVVSQVMKSGTLRDKVMVWKVLTEYERGKPIQPISGEGGGPVQIVWDSLTKIER